MLPWEVTVIPGIPGMPEILGISAFFAMFCIIDTNPKSKQFIQIWEIYIVIQSNSATWVLKTFPFQINLSVFGPVVFYAVAWFQRWWRIFSCLSVRKHVSLPTHRSLFKTPRKNWHISCNNQDKRYIFAAENKNLILLCSSCSERVQMPASPSCHHVKNVQHVGVVKVY